MLQFEFVSEYFFPVRFPVLISAPNWLNRPPGSKPLAHPATIRIASESKSVLIKISQRWTCMSLDSVWKSIILSQSTMENKSEPFHTHL